jgi:23S rRNA (uracil1939-C5)-methyltransferase
MRSRSGLIRSGNAQGSRGCIKGFCLGSGGAEDPESQNQSFIKENGLGFLCVRRDLAVKNMGKTITLDIEKIVYGGQGMGRTGGKVIFIPFTAPGDRVTAAIVKEKKDYLEGVLQKIETPSSKRVQPFCRFFGRCGGCQLQHLSYADQISVKEENLRGALHRLLKTGPFEILPTLPSPRERAYRIRAQFKTAQSGGKTILGFYGFKSHQIVEVDGCPLLHPLVNKILQELDSRIKGWKGKIQLQSADILGSPEEDKGVVLLRGAEIGDLASLGELVQGALTIKGACLQLHNKTSWGDLNLRFHLAGGVSKGSVEMSIPAGSFFQVNPYQNENLIQKVGEWAALTGRERVLDLFCGAGNLTLPLAPTAARIWGVDTDRKAIEAAGENARKNLLKNCVFLAMGADAGIIQILKETNEVDLLVLDPPRAGASEVLENLVKLHPRKILYVSCEPPTLVRDLVRLGELGYNVTRIQSIDMFPQTYHLEVIAELVRSGSRRNP